jgi:hypothetical protein
VAQGAYGLGAVTLTAFDLDQQPFIGWSGQAAFWEQLLARAGPRIPANVGQPNVFRYNTRGAPEGEADNQLQALNGQLETFEGVPVISFGWVALFILLYILLVGPLDYLFLKKVVKRLELTWVTFPTIVLAVSAAAYFTAYHLKGSELRVNKVDLVDVDLQTQRAYGRAWFSVFSPRIQKYTVGVEPAAPAWAAPPDGGPPDAVMSWFGVPKQGRQSLFRHSYDYAPQAAGLRGVPIQVWTTKGFQANWQAALDKDKPPVENRLRHPPGRPDDLIGSVTSHLPAPLEDVLLIYKGEAAWLGTLLPDTPRTLSAQNRVKFSVWRDNPDAGAANAGAASRLPMNLLFHEAMQGRGEPNNAAFRDLDQSWRVNDENRDEVILVGRLAQVLADGKTVTRPDGSTETHPTAEEMNGGPRVPSRLWLGNLPLDGGARPELRGSLRQDTIVRVFLPLQPEARPNAGPAGEAPP